MRIATFLLFLTSFLSQAQLIKQPDAAKIKLELKKLNSLGAVLYVAAHPDDENTRAIAFLVNDQLMTTGYLSLTRGDGGQNLIGPEIRCVGIDQNTGALIGSPDRRRPAILYPRH